jgi:hypothetical protein
MFLSRSSELSGDGLKISLATSTSGVSSLSLLTPVVYKMEVSNVISIFFLKKKAYYRPYKYILIACGVIELTRPGLSGRVATRSTGVLLDVKRATTTSLAESVRLVVTLTETGGTLCRKKKKIVSKRAS